MLHALQWKRSLRTKFGEHGRAVTNSNAIQPVARHLQNNGAVIAFLIWKCKPSVPFLVAMIAAKDMKCASFPDFGQFTLLALMNALATFNSHLSPPVFV